ncbi:unnamed protein product [Closterium sp. NIES-64]|nr:unnamed protein product [Closterium sp. NIES-64]CAI5954720.1 unnamed protein product [Closterium sp. NIES-64]
MDQIKPTHRARAMELLELVGGSRLVLDQGTAGHVQEAHGLVASDQVLAGLLSRPVNWLKWLDTALQDKWGHLPMPPPGTTRCDIVLVLLSSKGYTFRPSTVHWPRFDDDACSALWGTVVRIAGLAHRALDKGQSQRRALPRLVHGTVTGTRTLPRVSPSASVPSGTELGPVLGPMQEPGPERGPVLGPGLGSQSQARSQALSLNELPAGLGSLIKHLVTTVDTMNRRLELMDSKIDDMASQVTQLQAQVTALLDPPVGANASSVHVLDPVDDAWVREHEDVLYPGTDVGGDQDTGSPMTLLPLTVPRRIATSGISPMSSITPATPATASYQCAATGVSYKSSSEVIAVLLLGLNRCLRESIQASYRSWFPNNVQNPVTRTEHIVNLLVKAPGLNLITLPKLSSPGMVTVARLLHRRERNNVPLVDVGILVTLCKNGVTRPVLDALTVVIERFKSVCELLPLPGPDFVPLVDGLLVNGQGLAFNIEGLGPRRRSKDEELAVGLGHGRLKVYVYRRLEHATIADAYWSAMQGPASGLGSVTS